MIVIAGQGSGESLEREEYIRAIELVESGRIDLVLTEDLGRICRRVHAHIFCETCEDNGTRLYCPQRSGRHCSRRMAIGIPFSRSCVMKRITGIRLSVFRRTLRNRFIQGGVFQFVVFGYIKQPGARGEGDVAKDPRPSRFTMSGSGVLNQGQTSRRSLTGSILPMFH
jgi:hypothetical protein